MRKLRTFLAALLIVGLVSPLGADTLTVYPDAGTGSTTVDGGIYRANEDASWDLCRNNTTGSLRGNSAAYCYIIGEHTGSGFQIEHLFTNFDTSALTAGASISAAVYSLYPNTGDKNTSETTNPANPQLYEGTTASANTLVNDDYNNFGATAFCDSPPTQATMAASSAYHDFTMNASGIAAISKTGVTKLAVRPLNAVTGNAPTLRSYLGIYMADQAGTSNDPKLVVTYTTGSTFVPKIITVSTTAPLPYWMIGTSSTELLHANF